MKRLLPAVALVAALGACAGGPIRVYDASNASWSLAKPENTGSVETPGEPSVCLFAWHGNHFVGELGLLRDSGRFRSLLLLTDGHEPKDCGVLLSIRQGGSPHSIAGTSYVEAYSPHGGDQVLRAQAEGGWGKPIGFAQIAFYLKTELQEGRPLRSKLEELRGSKPLIGSDTVVKLAENDPLTWDGLIRAASSKEERVQLEASRDRAAAAVAETASSDEEESTSAADSDSPEAVKASDLDELPAAGAPAPRSYAVVIGIERYRGKLPNADFSAGDAKLAAEYFKRVLGVPEENMVLLTDADAAKSDFEKYLERWLPNRVESGDTVYVYYSGHGAPNPAKGDAYLVPYDGDPAYIEETGYPVKRLFEQLAKLPAKQVFVAMDSCFSGAGGRSVIAKGARPLVSVVQNDVPARISVLSASAGDQISNSYQEKGRGLFTYFFLKGLKEKGADFHAVYDYLKPEVARVARREYNSEQNPQWRQGR